MKHSIIYSLLFLAFLLSNCNTGFEAIDNGVFISDLDDTKIEIVYVKNETLEKTLIPRLAKAVSEDVTVTLSVDEDYLTTYNIDQDKSYDLLPDDKYEFLVDYVVIKAGDVEPTDSFNILLQSVDDISEDGDYILPLSISSTGGNVSTVGGYDYELLNVKAPTIINYPRFGTTTKDLHEFTLDDGVGFIAGDEFTLEFNVAHDVFNKTSGVTGDPLFYCAYLKFYMTFGDTDRYPYNLRCGYYGDTYEGDYVFNDNEWYHIAVVCNQYSASIYFNGELEATLTTDRDLLVESFKVYLNGAKYGSNGIRALSEYRIWSIERTQQELIDYRWSVPANSDSLQFYWKMNEGEGTTLYESAHANYVVDGGDTTYYDIEAAEEIDWALDMAVEDESPF
jgi:hypothetical protein